MTSTISSSVNQSPRYIPPKHFADYLLDQQDYCLLLDIDGTLADFTLNPKDSVIPNSTLAVLQKIQSYGVNIAIVTGRSLVEARQMLSPMTLPIAATHGLEIAFDEGDDKTNSASVDTIELAAIRQAIIQSCTPYNDFIVESKPYSVALHFRQNPALANAAYTVMAEALKNYDNWVLKPGKYVWEAVPKGINKGTAILTLIEKMQTDGNICPIFIGDDLTDEAGFMAVQGESVSIKNHTKPIPVIGLGIKVGYESNQITCARYYVHNIHEVTVLLDSFLMFYKRYHALSSK